MLPNEIRGAELDEPTGGLLRFGRIPAFVLTPIPLDRDAFALDDSEGGRDDQADRRKDEDDDFRTTSHDSIC